MRDLNDSLNAPATHTTNHILLHLLIFTTSLPEIRVFIYTPLPFLPFSSLEHSFFVPRLLLLLLLYFNLFILDFPAKMETKRSRQSTSLLLLLCATLLSQNLLVPVVTSQPTVVDFHDQKTYYPPDPNAHPPPTGYSSFISRHARI